MATPERDFWPFMPLPQVLWVPEPCPRPTRFFGRVDAHALAIEKIDGAVPLTMAPDRFDNRRAHFRNLRRVIDRFLDRGFAHLDMRARRNVLVRPDGTVDRYRKIHLFDIDLLGEEKTVHNLEGHLGVTVFF